MHRLKFEVNTRLGQIPKFPPPFPQNDATDSLIGRAMLNISVPPGIYLCHPSPPIMNITR